MKKTDVFKEMLVFSVQQAVGDIENTVKAIQKELERLLRLRDAERSFMEDTAKNGAQASVDESIGFLDALLEELLKEKENDLKLLRLFEDLEAAGERDPYLNGDYSSIRVTNEAISEQAGYCEVEAIRVSYNAENVFLKVNNVIDHNLLTGEGAKELSECVACYKSTANNLAGLCEEISKTLKTMSEAYDSIAFDALARNDEAFFGEWNSGLQSSVPPSAQFKPPVAAPSPSSACPPPRLDSVRFSAIAPQNVSLGKYFPISVVMYEDAFRDAVDSMLQAHGENSKESKSGYVDVERDSVIKVVLNSRDVTVEDGELSQKWNGKYLNFQFAVKLPSGFAEEQIVFTAEVYVNGMIATKLKLILDCEQKNDRMLGVSERDLTREDIISAFVSYASQDRARVAAIIQGMKKARPDLDIFFDVESLRSGQRWEEVLKAEISGRDILFLCWSRHARESKWVDLEWRYALESKGEDCIEPIPIESPDICPPPAELQYKHFNDKMLYIIKAHGPVDNKRACLVRIKTDECFEICKSAVSIGKQEAYVDFFIGDNPVISRCHAIIVERDGAYYIKDTNSKNHTYVNGELIPSNVETLICSGSKIRLADEEFEFLQV